MPCLNCVGSCGVRSSPPPAACRAARLEVTVLRVNTVMVPPKTGRNMRRPTRRPVPLSTAWKKAIVTLKEGDKIELGGVNYFES